MEIPAELTDINDVLLTNLNTQIAQKKIHLKKAIKVIFDFKQKSLADNTQFLTKLAEDC